MAAPGFLPDTSNPVFGRSLSDPASWQWQPIAFGDGAAHDPNPPILIEDPTPVAVTNVPSRSMMGVGF